MGAHRSGTSMPAQLLHNCGLFLPELKGLVIVRNPLEVAYFLRNPNEDASYSFGLQRWEIDQS
jgi:hypothetical protein